MIFPSDDVSRVELRLFVDEVPRAGQLVRTPSGGLALEPVAQPGVSFERLGAWLASAGLQVVERRRRGRRWIIRARLE